MFVIETDFDTPPLNLPGLDKVDNSFITFVDEQEEAELSKLFGYKFWKAFKAGVEALPADWTATNAPGYGIGDQVVYGTSIFQSLTANNLNNVPVVGVNWSLISDDNRWLLLKLGADYSYLGVDYKWSGMTALVKPMIYSLWLRYVIDNKVTSVGNVKNKTENSDVVSPNVRICRTWNDYDRLAAGSRKFTQCASIDNNIYGYLYANSSTFDDVVTSSYTDMKSYLNREFQTPGRMNIFDL